MYKVEMLKVFRQIIAVYYCVGLWPKEEQSVFRKTGARLMHLIMLTSYFLSFVTGAYSTPNSEHAILLIAFSATTAVQCLRLVYLLWKRKEILEFLYENVSHSIDDREEFHQINSKLEKFQTFAASYIKLTIMGFVMLIVSYFPIFSDQKRLILEIGFPFDWRNDPTSFWIAGVFLFTVNVFAVLVSTFGLVIMYLMLNFSIKYQVLGNELERLGWVTTVVPKENQLEATERDNASLHSLVKLIKRLQDLHESVDRFKESFEFLFFAQIATSSICICGSVYVLAFYSHENLMQSSIFVMYLIYNIFDILTILYFGNEIKLRSMQLMYCQFESNWFNQSKRYKRCAAIFSEILKKPKELV